MKILVTGATGKVGRHLIDRILSEEQYRDATIVALCHQRVPPPHPRVSIVKGSIADADLVELAMRDVSHVIHLATVKETPQAFIDISIKGLFNVLNAALHTSSVEQFILVGGDAAVGHCFVKHERPVTEEMPRQAYPGVYALSKVLEETMVEQYRDQYGLPITILRAPWIMERDDFHYALTFGPQQFGGPSWDSLIDPQVNMAFASQGRVPLLLDVDGRPLLRNFVHVDDLVSALLVVISNPRAIGELFHIAMTRPVDYAELCELLSRKGLQPATIKTPFHSNHFSNAKARFSLRWEPSFDLEKLIAEAFSYERSPSDPRTITYPG